MLLGPVFSAEVVTSSRRARYFVVRALYASILLFAFFIVASEYSSYSNLSSINQIAYFSSYFFQTFAVLQLVAVVLVTPAIAAGTIATERERRTIEYLFTTDLRNSEIVLSKLSAKLLQMTALLLAGLPVLSLAMLLGGVAPEALVFAFLVALSTTVVVASLSVALSVWSKRARDAIFRVYLVLIALLFVPVVIQIFQFAGGIPSAFYSSYVAPVNDSFLLSNPFYVWSAVLSQASGVGAVGVWDTFGPMLVIHLVVSCLSVFMAIFAVRRVHLKSLGAASEKKRRWQLPRFRPQLGKHPMLWKELFSRQAGTRLGIIGRIAITVIGLAALLPPIWMFIFAITDNSSGSYQVDSFHAACTFSTTAIGCGMLLLIAARAAGSITSERERDCWTSLICTPLSSFEIVTTKVLGSVYAVRGLWLILFLIWGLQVAIDFRFLIVVPFLLVTFVAIAWFASSLGVLFSLRLHTSLRAMGATMAVSLFVGGGYLFCCIPLFIAANGSDSEVALALCVPFLLAIPEIMFIDSPPSSMLATLVATYVIGLMCYYIVALLLHAAAVFNFDLLVGRVCFVPRRPAVGPIQELIAPEMVEESTCS